MNSLHERGLSYSSINSARSALSAFIVLKDGSNVGTNSFVTRFLKGIFNIKPPLPRYNSVWDAKVVLNFIRSLGDNASLSLKMLTLKLCMLMALVSAQRCQTLCALSIDGLTVTEDSVTFHINTLLKTCRQGKLGKTVKFQVYSIDEHLCVKRCIDVYIERTREVRGQEKQLLISFVHPYRKVGTDSVARWIKTVLALSGIDTDQFKAHSTRAASVSACVRYIPVEDIVKRAGWSNETTFQRFYNKTVESKDKFQDTLFENNDV